jgi:hypothetical protein
MGWRIVMYRAGGGKGERSQEEKVECSPAGNGERVGI